MRFCGSLLILLFITYKLSDIKRILFSTIIGLEYAALDEFHQLFVDGRAGSVIDVFIDTIGVALGVLFVMIVYKIITKKKEGVLE